MTLPSPLVSVCLPVYNTAAYLPRCIESLLAQDETNFEILAVNDGSTDNSLAVLRQYAAKDPRIKIFDVPNQGPAAARNLALQQAKGKYMMFCDSDDWVEPNWVSTLLSVVVSGQADMAVCNCQIEEEKNHGRTEAAARYNYIFQSGIMDFAEARFKINRVLWNKIFNLDFIRRHQISFPQCREHDDNAFLFIYFSLPGKMKLLKNKKLYHYTLRENSLMGRLYHKKSTGHEWDLLYSEKFISDWLLKHHCFEEFEEAFWVELNMSLRLCMRMTEGEDAKKQMMQKAIELFGDLPVNKNKAKSDDLQALFAKEPDLLFKSLHLPDEKEEIVKIAGFPLLRKVQGWDSKKIYFLGQQIYKQEPWFKGGKRYVLGIPVGRTNVK